MGKGPALSDGPFHQALASGGADRSGIGGGTTRRLEAVFQGLKCDSVENRGRQLTAIEARTRIAVRGAPRSTRCEERHRARGARRRGERRHGVGLHAIQADYVEQERVAIGARLGVHKHDCEKPWDWRARSRGDR